MPREDVAQQLVVCRLVIGCHKCLQHEHFCPDHVYTEKLLHHFGERFQADAVGDVLQHDPAFQAMEVLVQALMVVRYKLGTALQTSMDGGATGNDFAFHPAGRQHQIKGPLDSGFLGPHLFLDTADEVLTFAHRASCGHDDNVLGHSECPIWTLVLSHAALPQGVAGADIDSVSLVVEVGTLIDVFVIRVYEGDLAPRMEIRELLHVFEEGDGRTVGLLERGRCCGIGSGDDDRDRCLSVHSSTLGSTPGSTAAQGHSPAHSALCRRASSVWPPSACG